MDDVQLALLSLGFIVIIVMILHNWTLLKKHQKPKKNTPTRQAPAIDDDNDPLFQSSEFKINENGMKIILDNKGYSTRDDFYKSEGSYSCFKTCNSWVNIGFKKSGLKSCYWTPFDFGLINKYE